MSTTHRRLIAYVLALHLMGPALPACSSLTAEPPPVPDSTMVEVLVELHLAEARTELYGRLPEGLRDSALAKHGLTQREYKRAVDYYTDHPTSYADLYDTVLDRLSAERHAVE